MKCPACGHERNGNEMKCPECGSFYSRITQIIAEQEELEEMETFSGRWKRNLESGGIKQAVLAELNAFKQGLSKQGKFALFVIFVFVFALIVSVL
ncbi:MAG: hypothetical protein ACXWF8_07675 [Methylobacter sp.]